MYFDHRIIEKAITFEGFFIIALVISIYILKLFYFLKKKRDLFIEEQIKNYLDLIMESPALFSPKNFPDRWKRLDIILPIIQKNKQVLLSFLATTGKEIVQAILLPIARKKVRSRKWIDRLLAAQCFLFFMEDHDGEFVAFLLNDSIPLVHLYAAFAAIKHGDKKLRQLVLCKMSEKRRLAQNVYLKSFEAAAPDTRTFVEECLENEQNSFVRATCYKILLLYPPGEISVDLNADIESKNIELSLSAIKFMVYSQKEKAVSSLLKLLSAKPWEIRASSIRLLGDLQAVQTIAEIAQCLSDSAWWVRMNAAHALHSFGEKGTEVLKAQDPDRDLFAYEAAMHVLQYQSSTIRN